MSGDHECVFVEEQEPTGRLILPPCLVCGMPAMDALEILHDAPETVPMNAPKRVRMSRKHPWRAAHPAAVIVARPSRWGNPYEVVKEWGAWGVRPPGYALIVPETASLTRAEAHAHAVEFYRVGLWQRADEIRTALAGRDLACWCALDVPCHADALLEIANEVPR